LIENSPFINVKKLKEIYTPNQYFIDNIIKFSNNEVFIDAGAYNGNNSLEFSNLTKETYNSIYCFEPDKNNIKNLKEKTKKLNNLKIYNYGLSDKKEQLFFSSKEGSSKIEENGGDKIECEALDNIIKNEKISFIKMDIEGYELKALKGSQNLIQKYKPKLAICIYHKTEDFWEIINYIKFLSNDYKIYIRHHHFYWWETVLYAI
jgi:FkbM family methyltransferase